MKLARDTWLTFQYEVGQLVHSPVSIALSLLQPVTYLLLFTPFIKSVMGASSYGAAYGIYVPSLFAAMGIFSGMFAGFALIGAIRQGVIGRLRVTPLSRVGLLLGRELVFVALVAFQAVVIAVVALIFGLRVPLPNLLLALVLLALMVLIGVSISYMLAIHIPNDQALMNLTNGVTEPLALLAGVLIPLSVAPLWVRRRRHVEPVRLGDQQHAGHLPGPHRRPGRLGGDHHPGRGRRAGRGGVVTAVHPRDRMNRTGRARP